MLQSTITKTTGTGTYISSSIQSVGNGWYKATIKGIPRSTSGPSMTARMYLLQTPTGPISYTGNGTRGVYVWGAELLAVK